MRYFDAHVIALGQLPNSLPNQLSGVIFFGPDALIQRRECSLVSPERLWGHASSLNTFTEPADEKFTALERTVIDLQLPDTELLSRLQAPVSEWWPLAGTARGARRFLHLTLPAGAAPAASLRRIIKSYPRTVFMIDPFRHGPVPGWQAQIRLAEFDNVRLTTIGIVPGATCRWAEAEKVSDALYFTVGEAGAGKILFASGLFWGYALDPSIWLDGIHVLNPDQKSLILEHNARELFDNLT